MSFIRFEQRCESVAPDLLRPDPCPTNKVVHRYIILYGDEINGKKKFSTFLSKEKIMRERERKGAKEERGLGIARNWIGNGERSKNSVARIRNGE